MEDLISLLNTHAGTPHRTVLVCAQGVWEKLKASGAPVAICHPWEFDVSELTGTGVIIAKGYEPGRWKLIRHDKCEVIGGETIDQALIVHHEGCAVIAEHDPAKMRPADMTDEQFLTHRAWLYQQAGERLNPEISLLEFMGMSPREYAEWFLDGVIPERLMRVDGRR